MTDEQVERLAYYATCLQELMDEIVEQDRVEPYTWGAGRDMNGAWIPKAHKYAGRRILRWLTHGEGLSKVYRDNRRDRDRRKKTSDGGSIRSNGS